MTAAESEWAPTGRTRLRGTWLGFFAYEIEETRRVNTWLPGTPHSPMNWQPVYRWRRHREPFGSVIDLQGTATARSLEDRK